MKIQIKNFFKKTFIFIRNMAIALLLLMILSESATLSDRFMIRTTNTKPIEILKPNPIKKENTKTYFCGQLIEKDEITFLLDFISSTESQGHTFRSNDVKIKKESWTRTSKFSTAIGKWQFLKSTREQIAKELGEPIPTKHQFLSDSVMQTRYMIKYLEDLNDKFSDSIHIYKHNKLVKIYPPAYEMFEGKVINGYYVSKAGMLCLGHGLGYDGTVVWLLGGCNPKKLPEGILIADRRLTVKDIFND